MSTIHITLSFLFFFTFNFRDLSAVSNRHMCRPEQRDALLQFKNQFDIQKSFTAISYPKTESWRNSSDCCYWDGIKCDAKSGEVMVIDLSNSCLHGRFHPDSTLSRLQYLTILDLSFNDLYGPIPSSVEKLSHLTSLNLSGNLFSGQIPSSIKNLSHLTSLHLSNNMLSGQIPSSIENLSHLTSLDFSSNQFSGQIPYSIGKLTHLTCFELFLNQFSGQIPSSIGNLSHLKSLGFSSNKFNGQIPSSIGKLSHLNSLDLHTNQFRGEIPSSIGNLSLVKSLDFSNNRFSGQIPSSIGKISHIESLDFSHNHFSGQIPSSIGNFSNLLTLDLSFNNLYGKIPFSLGNLNQLISFNVDSNKFSGIFPIALLNLTNLMHLSLSYNQLTGTLPSNVSSLSNLEGFYASDNTFVGTLSFSLFTVLFIDFSNNQLDSTLECGNTSSLRNISFLNLGGNKFKGPIPPSISKLVNLVTLDLSNWNSQSIKVDLSIFSNLKSLQKLGLSHLNTTTIDLNEISSFSKSLNTLYLSGNHVLAGNKSSVSDPPLLSYLYLSDCGITEFPEILRTQLLMEILDISNNRIEGQVPGWLWTLPKLHYVNLSNNTFIGFESSRKHGLSSAMTHLFGSKNNLSGNIPSFICKFYTLRTLDLSDNNINGSIPLCLENLKTNLSVLNLRQNHLSGDLPSYVFENLRSFDVGHNQLVGKLPISLINFSRMEVLNVESNRINDTFPFWLSSLQNLQVLVLRSNAFHGPIHQASFFTLKIIDISHNHFNGILPWDYFVNWSNMSSPWKNEDQSVPSYMGDESGYYHDSMVLISKGIEMKMVRILTIYTALDFSGNRLEGEIPKSISLLKELHVLNLSNNAFSGHIPSSMANLTALESLDVSQNKLSGDIPQELGNLSYLEYMNFSHNQFVGLVPGGTQFRRQPCSSFEPNSGLFGPALDDDCKDIHMPLSQQSETPEEEEEEDEEEEEVISWIAAAIGFVPSVVFGFTIGFILDSYKLKWFTSPFGQNKRRSRSSSSH